MLIHLSEVSSKEGSVVHIDAPYSPDTFTYMKETFELTDHRSGSFDLEGLGKGRLRIDCTFEVEAMIPCDRCLEPVKVLIPGDFSLEWDTAQEGEDADTDDILFTEILMRWPMKVLCKDDCRGICMKCGQNLNLGACKCDTFVPDPRMAAILDIFEKSKEV